MFMDANARNINYDTIKEIFIKSKSECVIFTFNSWIIEFDLRICTIIKEIDSSCITIGYSWYAENSGFEILSRYKDLDIQLINDPFSVIEDLITTLDNNRDLSGIEGIAFRNKNSQIVVNDKLTKRKSFDNLPLPAYDLIPSFKPYYLYSPYLKPYALVYAGKGCPFSCTYCPDANTQYSGRSGESIVKELEVLKKLGKIKYIWFYDEIFTINRKRIIDVCRKINEKNLKIKWFCDSRADLVDEELLKVMKMGGCIGISYGIESGSQKILNSMKKSITTEQAKNALKWTRNVNIPIQLNLLLGYVGEDKKTIEDTKNLVRITLPDILQISIILAINGTEFTNLALKNNWISNDLSWQEKITNLHIDKKRYKPFQLNLTKEIRNIYKMLYLNPKWWLNGFKTLIKNYQLIIPILGILLNPTKSIKIL
jgi:radical SAM superfamily enzyme YgiQ (UPF0313 family)